MKREELISEIKRKKSFLCVGLDTDINKIPASLQKEKDPVFAFNKIVIDQTSDLCVAYKLNAAFYEQNGTSGWESFRKTEEYIPQGIFKIADAKRGDIGNTSKQYAKAFFEQMNFDAITVSPYMGYDSISPFMEFENKWVIILALTSNKGSLDFQMLRVGDEFLYEKVLKTSSEWGSTGNIMFVVGATHPEAFLPIRQIIPDHFMLIPGVGAQGGSIDDIGKYALNKDTGVLVNVSRGILFPGDDADFPANIKKAALDYQKQMLKWIED